MNDQWIERLRAEPVDVDPRPGFNDELRATILAERNETSTTSNSASGTPRRWWLLGAVAGCVAILIGGLVLLADDDRALTPSTMPQPTTVTTPEAVPSTDREAASTTMPEAFVPVTTVAPDLVVSDPVAISLDDWIDAAATPPVAAAVVEIDRQALPAGWSVSDEAGALLAFPNDVLGYSYTAVVTTDDQAVFDVTFARDTFSDPCFLPVSQFPGTVGDLTGATVGDAVCGQTDDGSTLAVVPVNGSDTARRWSALDIAEVLSFVEADELPHRDLTVVAGDDEPAAVDFAGTLSGVRWAVTVEPSGTRRMDNYVAGNFSTGMESSQETGDVGQALPVVESHLEGVPGYGAIAYGHVEGDAVAVIVSTNDQRTARLPMLPSEGRSAFAVPIPDTVAVATLTFIDDGTVVAIADVPDIPVGLGAGTLGLISRR